jgi:magnesium transporter
VVDSAALGAFIESVAGKNVWLDVQGLGDSNIIRMFGELLGLHPLVMEDIVHVHQRPKQEVYREYLFAVLRTLRVSAEGSIETEQISFVLKPNLLVTFQERPGDVSEPVRKRIREGKGLIRRAGADYLFYALVDAVVDNYFPVIETYEENMDLLDDAVREDPSPDVSRHIHGIRRQLRKFRRSVWPLRDMFAAFVRDDIDFIDEKTRLFFRDAHDHVILAVEFVEGARERASDLGDLYLSVVGEKTNRVMNLLTIIATIFIPLTFLCGVYGMNFDTEVSPYNMPELKWRYAYPVFWGVLIVIFVGMLWIFKRKGWIGKK